MDSTCITYKAPSGYSNNDGGKTHSTSLQDDIVKRSFRKPVFQEFKKDEIPLSDDESDNNEIIEKEETMKIQPDSSGTKYIVPHRRENKRNGIEEEQKQSRNLLPHLVRNPLGPSATDWKDFLPTRAKSVTADRNASTVVETSKTRLPERSQKVIDSAALKLPHQCDKCGSLLTEETGRTYSLSVSVADHQISTTSDPLLPETTTIAIVAASTNHQNEPLDVGDRQTWQSEMKGVVIERSQPGTSTQHKARESHNQIVTGLPSAPNRMWNSTQSLVNVSPTSPRVDGPPSASEGPSWLSSAELRDPNLKIIKGPEIDGLHTLLEDQAVTKVPSDLAYGWGPEEESFETTSNSTPRIMPEAKTGGIGWDSDDDEDKKTTASAARNEWDLAFNSRKFPSPGYAVSSARRSVVNVSGFHLT